MALSGWPLSCSAETYHPGRPRSPRASAAASTCTTWAFFFCLFLRRPVCRPFGVIESHSLGLVKNDVRSVVLEMDNDNQTRNAPNHKLGGGGDREWVLFGMCVGDSGVRH